MSRTYPRVSYRKPEKKYRVKGRRGHVRQLVGIPCVGCGNRTTGQIEIQDHWSAGDDERDWLRMCDDCQRKPEAELIELWRSTLTTNTEEG